MERFIKDKDIIEDMEKSLQEEVINSYDSLSERSIHTDINKPYELYKRLLESPFYDRETEQWNYDYNKNLKINHKFSTDQLLGVIALTSIGENGKAKEIYEKLIESPFYDKRKKLWNQFPEYKKLILYPAKFSTDQLLGVIALTSIGENGKAKEIYERIFKGPLYDQEETQHWNHNDCQDPIDLTRFLFSTDQLLGVIALTSIGENGKAKEIYERLFKGPLYNKEKKLWISEINKCKELRDPNFLKYKYLSSSQLLGVMALTSIGENGKAKEIYEKLIESPLYDKRKKLWNYSMSKKLEVGVDPFKFSRDQLLDVIILTNIH